MKLHAVFGGCDFFVAERRGRAGDMNFSAIGDQRAAQLAQKAEVTNEPWYDNEKSAVVFHCASIFSNNKITSSLCLDSDGRFWTNKS